MKTWFLIAGTLVLLGGLIFTMSSCATGWNMGGMREEKISEITEDFDGIAIESDTADISILPSEDESCKVVAYDIEKINYSVKVEDGILKIKLEDTRKWFESIIGTTSGSLTVYLPENEYSSLSINEDTGDITVKGFSLGNVDIKLSTGDVNLKDITCGDFSLKMSTGDTSIDGITCESLTSVGDTGDITVKNLTANGNVSIKRSTGHVSINTANISGNLSTETDTGKNNAKDVTCSGDFEHEVSTGKSELTNITCANFNSKGGTGNLTMSNVIATDKFSIKRDTGDVKFNRCDAQEIYVKTDTGDVTGTLLSEKIFITKTDTGSVKVPESYSGGKCKIETDTGDIKISIAQ